MKSFQEFELSVKELDKEIKDYYKEYASTTSKEIIGDGIVNSKEYYNSPIKIMWILKEAYDKDAQDDEETEGGWSLNELLNEEGCLDKMGRSINTWHPIIYASYGILNNFIKFDEMDYIKSDPSMINILRKIAIMNVQKFAANTTTNDNDIAKAYSEHFLILLKQIKGYNPDIIIGGKTILNFINDLELREKNHHYDEYDYWIKDNKLYIDANHPSQRVSAEDKENYIDDVIRIAESFYAKIKVQ